MSSSVYCNDIFQQLHHMFHTLKWEYNIRNNTIQFYRKYYELEIFEIEISQKYIYITIPLIERKINYCKKFLIEHFCDGIKFLGYHIDNYVKAIINRNDLYKENISFTNNEEQLVIQKLVPTKQYIICSS